MTSHRPLPAFAHHEARRARLPDGVRGTGGCGEQFVVGQSAAERRCSGDHHAGRQLDGVKPRDKDLAQRLRRFRGTFSQLGVEIRVAAAARVHRCHNLGGTVRQLTSGFLQSQPAKGYVGDGQDPQLLSEPARVLGAGVLVPPGQQDQQTRRREVAAQVGEEIQRRHIRPVHVLDDEHRAAFGDLPHCAHHRLDRPRSACRDRREHLPGGTPTHPERRVQSAVRDRAGQGRARAAQNPEPCRRGIRHGGPYQRRLPDPRITADHCNGRPLRQSGRQIPKQREFRLAPDHRPTHTTIMRPNTPVRAC
jgi:hypothetical protein